jgi:hypothetical protein
MISGRALLPRMCNVGLLMPRNNPRALGNHPRSGPFRMFRPWREIVVMSRNPSGLLLWRKLPSWREAEVCLPAKRRMLPGKRHDSASGQGQTSASCQEEDSASWPRGRI